MMMTNDEKDDWEIEAELIEEAEKRGEIYIPPVSVSVKNNEEEETGKSDEHTNTTTRNMNDDIDFEIESYIKNKKQNNNNNNNNNNNKVTFQEENDIKIEMDMDMEMEMINDDVDDLLLDKEVAHKTRYGGYGSNNKKNKKKSNTNSNKTTNKTKMNNNDNNNKKNNNARKENITPPPVPVDSTSKMRYATTTTTSPLKKNQKNENESKKEEQQKQKDQQKDQQEPVLLCNLTMIAGFTANENQIPHLEKQLTLMIHSDFTLRTAELFEIGAIIHSTRSQVNDMKLRLTEMDSSQIYVILDYPETLNGLCVKDLWERSNLDSKYECVNILKSLLRNTGRDLKWKAEMAEELERIACKEEMKKQERIRAEEMEIKLQQYEQTRREKLNKLYDVRRLFEDKLRDLGADRYEQEVEEVDNNNNNNNSSSSSDNDNDGEDVNSENSTKKNSDGEEEWVDPFAEMVLSTQKQDEVPPLKQMIINQTREKLNQIDDLIERIEEEEGIDFDDESDFYNENFDDLLNRDNDDDGYYMEYEEEQYYDDYGTEPTDIDDDDDENDEESYDGDYEEDDSGAENSDDEFFGVNNNNRDINPAEDNETDEEDQSYPQEETKTIDHYNDDRNKVINSLRQEEKIEQVEVEEQEQGQGEQEKEEQEQDKEREDAEDKVPEIKREDLVEQEMTLLDMILAMILGRYSSVHIDSKSFKMKSKDLSDRAGLAWRSEQTRIIKAAWIQEFGCLPEIN